MKLHTVIGVGFGKEQSFESYKGCKFYDHRMCVDYPNGGRRLIGDIQPFTGELRGNFILEDGFFHRTKTGISGIFSDRDPVKNNDKVLIIFMANGFVRVDRENSNAFVLKIDRISGSQTALAAFTLFKDNGCLSFHIKNSPDGESEISGHIVYDKKTDQVVVLEYFPDNLARTLPKPRIGVLSWLLGRFMKKAS